RGKKLDLPIAFFIGAEQIENDVTDTRGVEALNGLGDPCRRSERTIALRGLAKIHRVASAEGDGRDVERFLVGLVDPRKEEMSGAKTPLEPTPRLVCCRGDLDKALRVHLRCHGV